MYHYIMIHSILISLYHPELSLRILQIIGTVVNNFGTSILIIWVCLFYFILPETKEIQGLLSEPLSGVKRKVAN